jgi:hypothetical protein
VACVTAPDGRDRFCLWSSAITETPAPPGG